MEKVIEFFYYGEFEANAPLQKKVVDALKFLEVEDLLKPAPPKPKPMLMSMPTIPTNQPKTVPTTTQPKSMAPTTQPKSMAPTTQPKSINSTTQPKPMPPTTQSKPVASNMTATQTNGKAVFLFILRLDFNSMKISESGTFFSFRQIDYFFVFISPNTFLIYFLQLISFDYFESF